MDTMQLHNKKNIYQKYSCRIEATGSCQCSVTEIYLFNLNDYLACYSCFHCCDAIASSATNL